ncbi:F-box only protein 48 isoform X2 [Danio rerio]|uniref:F-box only protein 48 isoform b n=2 Tax=Danio rerio TaxID=7955 RepID=F1QC12_DANRE|nr:F-box only protein 48 isoform b [Danio rerio]|eukprot:NP_001314954.1 F-box only protein 48 isoform b [Danio rerio]
MSVEGAAAPSAGQKLTRWCCSGLQDPLQIERDFSEALPAEMSVRIFGELDVRSLCRASVTCKHWNDIIEGSDHLWRSHCLTGLAVCRREVNGDRLDGCSWKKGNSTVNLQCHSRA